MCTPTTVCVASEYLSCCSGIQETCTPAISSTYFCGCLPRLPDSHQQLKVISINVRTTITTITTKIIIMIILIIIIIIIIAIAKVRSIRCVVIIEMVITTVTLS